jgi:hypothetical protein
VVGLFQLQAKADAIAEPILHEVVSAEERPGGEGANGENGRDATDGAPAPEGRTGASSSHPSAGEV